MKANSIANIKTVTLQSPDGPLLAIMISVDLMDISTAAAFVEKIVEAFKNQRMMSPPDTRGLLITIIGDWPVAQFVEQWKRLVKTDQILAVL